MIVIWPCAALAAPPDTGASSISMRRSARRFPSERANSGATVTLMMTTLPGARASTAPPGPNSTLSACSELTTSTITAAQPCAISAAIAKACAPSLAKAARTSGRVSHTRTAKPARSSERATPPPIAPRPITPTVLPDISLSSEIWITECERGPASLSFSR